MLMINTNQANSGGYSIAACVSHFCIFAHVNIHALIPFEPSFKTKMSAEMPELSSKFVLPKNEEENLVSKKTLSVAIN